MERRTFLKKATTGLGTLALPIILPSGRLFASTGSQRIKYVVFCLFAGGIRGLESIQKAEGNLMPNTLLGTESISPDIVSGLEPIVGFSSSKPLQSFGTLYKKFRYENYQTQHFNAHVTAITGQYSPNASMMQSPEMPTVFEYYRKHAENGHSPLNAWWITDELGPYPFLNVSTHPDYGSAYAGNCISPDAVLNKTHLALTELNDYQEAVVNRLTRFFNHHFNFESLPNRLAKINNEEDAARVQRFLATEIDKFMTPDQTVVAKGLNISPELVNLDFLNIYTAKRVIEEFQPQLLVVNMQDSDIGHKDFTQYCSNIRKADLGLKKLWEAIQDQPEMRDNTVLIAAPEHGRNKDHNTILDQFGRYAVDHTGDDMSKDIFCLVLGPSDVVRQGGVIEEKKGESIDIIPTICHLLGFDHALPTHLLKGKVLKDALV